MCLAKPCSLFSVSLVLASAMTQSASGDWLRFRGPNGSGISSTSESLPSQWGDEQNLRWKIELPGPGSSSPIVVGERVFVTCWTGYGTESAGSDSQESLRRVLLAVDRSSGEVVWTREVAPYLPEDPYRGQFTQHGYATHTPTSDGERVYVFFGKTGVLAFDLDGNQLWQRSVGTESGSRNWGTSSSPILYEHLVIVPATAESESLVALDKTSGEEVWRQEANGFSSTWGTPTLVDVPGGSPELVIAVPYELWGFDPQTGKLKWYCNGLESDSVCTSVVAHEGVIYAVGGRGSALAVRAGGEDDVTGTHVLWSGSERARISTPLFHQGHLYFVAGGVAYCLDATTGERVKQQRLGRGTTPAADGQARPQRFGGGRGGGFGGQDYSSPVAGDGKLFFVSRRGTMHVLALQPELTPVATNQFSEGGDFSATPAISAGDIFIRSSQHLYCIAQAD